MTVNATWTLNRSLISDITNATNAVVTTTTAHGLTTGQYIYLFSTEANGMVIPYKQAQATVIDETSFSVDYDTTALGTFITPSFPPGYTPAQCIPQSGVNENTLNVRG